jgi:hypothetical protein
VNAPATNRLATAEISPSLHDRSTSIKAVGTPISSLHRSPDLSGDALSLDAPILVLKSF